MTSPDDTKLIDAKIAAGYAHVEVVKPNADGWHGSAPWFYGWAVREAFVAGARWQEALTATQGEPVAWAKLKVLAALETMSAGASAFQFSNCKFMDFTVPLYTHPATQGEVADYETCSSCGGSGLQLGQGGEPTECHECRGNTVVYTHPAMGELVEALRECRDYIASPFRMSRDEDERALRQKIIDRASAALTKHGGDRG